MDFTDILKDLNNGENMGGTAQIAYFAYHKDVAAWPTRPSSPATAEENGKLTGDVTMKAGKKMFELYVTDDTGEFQIEPVGEKDGKSFVLHLRLFHPGLKNRILGFINAAKNENLVFIVPDNNGHKFLMGDALRPATFEGSDENSGTGKETAGRRGIGMHFTYKTSNVYNYEGNVPLTEAASV